MRLILPIFAVIIFAVYLTDNNRHRDVWDSTIDRIEKTFRENIAVYKKQAEEAGATEAETLRTGQLVQSVNRNVEDLALLTALYTNHSGIIFLLILCIIIISFRIYKLETKINAFQSKEKNHADSVS